MQFQRINRTDAEICFGIFKNVSGTTISGNYPVCFTTTSGSNDGISAVPPAASNNLTLAGVADANVANTEYGRFQAYGFRNSVAIYAHGASVTIAAGVAIGPGATSNGFGSTGLKETFGPLVTMETVGAAVCSGGGFAKAFIRNL
jgi:hypothetical protein